LKNKLLINCENEGKSISDISKQYKVSQKTENERVFCFLTNTQSTEIRLKVNKCKTSLAEREKERAKREKISNLLVHSCVNSVQHCTNSSDDVFFSILLQACYA
jgi:hypothetical protein